MKINSKEFMSKIKSLALTRLITITCIVENGFRLLYQFDQKNKIISLSVFLSKKKPVIESIMNLFPTAELYEREIHDFFGVEFKGNPKLHEKLFLAEEWKGKPPLLKHTKQEVK